ncbi:MAG: hypothetical protein ACOYN2_01725 [Patescibacteria group bacterium]
MKKRIKKVQPDKLGLIKSKITALLGVVNTGGKGAREALAKAVNLTKQYFARKLTIVLSIVDNWPTRQLKEV